MKNKISILVPCFNSEASIEKCLISIINQSYKEIEIIIVDDGSTDNSKEIIEKIMIDKNNIKLICQSNKGLAKTRNILIKEVKTDFFFFVDSDDFLDSNLIENFANELRKKPNSDIIVNTCLKSKNGKSKKWYVCGKYKKNYTIKNYLSNNAIFAWNILFRNSFIKENNLSFSEVSSFFEDCGSLNYWFTKSNNISVINKPGYHYVFSKNSLSNKDKMNFYKIDAAIKQYLNLETKLSIVFNDEFPEYINNQLVFYRSILHTYIFLKSDVSALEKKELKMKFKKIEKRKLKFPKNFWMFWYFLLTKIIK